jgi:hypothetical protein
MVAHAIAIPAAASPQDVRVFSQEWRVEEDADVVFGRRVWLVSSYHVQADVSDERAPLTQICK